MQPGPLRDRIDAALAVRIQSAYHELIAIADALDPSTAGHTARLLDLAASSARDAYFFLMHRWPD